MILNPHTSHREQALFGPDTKHFTSFNSLILTTAQREKGLILLIGGKRRHREMKYLAQGQPASK